MSQVESTLLGIGEMARRSGLSVSALRYYDGAGLLVPASVDAASGYRRYRPDQVVTARVLANLRRVGDAPPGGGARPCCAHPVRRRCCPRPASRPARGGAGRCPPGALPRPIDFSNSRRPPPCLSRLSPSPRPSSPRPSTPVRFAVSTDPELPALGGVLVETDGVALRLVTTDRFRLAVADAGGQRRRADRHACSPAPRSSTRCAVCSTRPSPPRSRSAPERVVVRLDGTEHAGRAPGGTTSRRTAMLLPGRDGAPGGSRPARPTVRRSPTSRAP